MASDPIQGSELTGEITELREEVLTYEPGNVSTCADNVEFPKQLYIGLFGRTGCGKTSLINSLKFAAHGKLRRSKWQQAAGQEKAGGHTMFRKLADITKTIFAIDNRGLDDPNTENAIAELAAQLDGKRGYSESVEWQEAGDGNDTDDLEDEGLDLSGIDLNKGHPIGCAVFVFSALHDIETNTTGLDEVINFLHSHQGRYPVAIITHVDVAEKNRVEDLRTVLRVYGVSDIFEVANLTPENFVLKEPYQHSLLSLLERCMTDGDETLIFKHYQRKEQQRQKEIEKRREEKRRKQDEARIAEENKQKAEKERIEGENQMKRELEEKKREIEREREREREEERAEKKYKQEQARIAEECRRMDEKERIERENQMRRELEEQRRINEIERERAEKQEKERREQEMRERERERREQEMREQERREQERERREQERREQERREQDRREHERERREQERDRRYDETLNRIQGEKQAEIRRIMEANKREDSKCKMM